jgi:protein-S-isoprenylcysteine O-methyltransferase Ste14
MISIGNFLFKYRNYLFVVLYLALFLPSKRIFTEYQFGENYYLIPIILGLLISVSGLAIRALTLGLTYLVTTKESKKMHAESLITGGVFNHCRNPLYLGNILMWLGLGIISNSLLFLLILIPLLMFVYQAIVLAEERFLRAKFGDHFDRYRRKVKRWSINLRGITKTIDSMKFSWRRWILKEYNILFIWLSGITLLILLKYPEIIYSDTDLRTIFIAIAFAILLSSYLLIRYLKRSGKMVD